MSVHVIPVEDDITIDVTNDYLGEVYLGQGSGLGRLRFMIKRSTKLKKLFNKYAKHYIVKDSTILHFTFNGKRLSETDTAESINIEDGGEIECFTPSEVLLSELIDVCKSDNLSLDTLKEKVNLIGQNTIREKCEECAYLGTFLHLACMNKNITLEIINYLLDMFPEAANSLAMERIYPLHLACSNQYCPESVIERLVQSNPEICNVKGRPIHGAEELPLHHYLSRNINVDRNVIVLPPEYTEALLGRIKELVSEWENEDNNIISDEEMRIIAANVPTTVEKLADYCGLSENTIQTFGELIIKNITSFIKEEELEGYIENLTHKDDDDVSMDRYDSTDESSVDSADVSLQHTLEQIKINDPATTSLYIPFGDDDVFGAIDWKNEAQYFSSNTHLKRILYSGMDTAVQYPIELMMGLDQNRSIENIAFHYCKGSFDDDTKCMFNHNLRCLEFIGCSPDFVITILSMFHKDSLQEVNIEGFDMGQHQSVNTPMEMTTGVDVDPDYGRMTWNQYRAAKREQDRVDYKSSTVEQLNEELNQHQNIKQLSLGLVNSTMEKALVTLQRTPSVRNLMITVSNQHHNLMDIVLELTILKQQYSDNVMKYNLLMLPQQSRQILNLNLSDGEMNDEDITSLADQLATTKGLYSLRLANRPSVTQNGWNECFSRLASYNTISTLQEFDLYYNRGITDDVITTLIGALGSMISLKKLKLRLCRSITSRGWQAFSALFRSENCNLKRLDISSTEFDTEALIAFAAALVNNYSLIDLSMNDCGGYITDRGWSALANALCDKSSIEATMSSNHKLQYVHCMDSLGGHEHVPRDLGLNGGEPREEVVRQKIIRYHMSTFDGINNEFVDMDLGVMPSAISWIGRDDIGHSALYQLFRSLPGLFERNETVAKRKRKRL